MAEAAQLHVLLGAVRHVRGLVLRNCADAADSEVIGALLLCPALLRIAAGRRAAAHASQAAESPSELRQPCVDGFIQAKWLALRIRHVDRANTSACGAAVGAGCLLSCEVPSVFIRPRVQQRKC